MNKPTVGRQVHYRPTAEENERFVKAGGNKAEILPATITSVSSDTCVNLKVQHDGPGDTWKTSVQMGGLEGHWNWPVIVPAAKEVTPPASTDGPVTA